MTTGMFTELGKAAACERQLPARHEWLAALSFIEGAAPVHKRMALGES